MPVHRPRHLSRSSGQRRRQFNHAGTLYGPAAVAIDPSGNLWVTDIADNRVEEFNSAGSFQLAIGAGYQGAAGTVGTSGTAGGQFNDPLGIAIDRTRGYVWVDDNANYRVQKFNSSGSYLGQLGCASGQCTNNRCDGQFENLISIAVDPVGNVWVGDWGCGIEEFSRSGSYLQTITRSAMLGLSIPGR
jgi:tripartite motif-containing protein 71